MKISAITVKSSFLSFGIINFTLIWRHLEWFSRFCCVLCVPVVYKLQWFWHCWPFYCMYETAAKTSRHHIPFQIFAHRPSHKLLSSYTLCINNCEYSNMGWWLDILWCSVCLSLTFVTFFVKSTFLAHINSNKVYFKFILFLSIAVLRVCVEDRHSFTESRRVCTGVCTGDSPVAACIGDSRDRI